MSPVIVRESDIAPADDGIGTVVVVVETDELEEVEALRWSVESDFAAPSVPPPPSDVTRASAARDSRMTTMTGTARLDTP
jgi:hypothetical protein